MLPGLGQPEAGRAELSLACGPNHTWVCSSTHIPWRTVQIPLLPALSHTLLGPCPGSITSSDINNRERERERETWSAPLLCRLPPSRAQLVEQALLERCCWPLQLRNTEVNEARWFSYFPLTAQSAGACRPAMVQGGGMKEPSTVDRLSGRQLGSKKARRGGNR